MAMEQSAADSWLIHFESVVKGSNLPWEQPLRNSIVFEWWVGSKKVTIYLGQDSVEYIKVWHDEEMEDGDCKSDQDLLSLWKWLITDPMGDPE